MMGMTVDKHKEMFSKLSEEEYKAWEAGWNDCNSSKEQSLWDDLVRMRDIGTASAAIEARRKFFSVEK